jgi:uncharacterized protein YbjT (DUF2867 family)
MYVILGASGNTGHVVAQHLLSRGNRVRVVGRNADHLQFLAFEGAEKFVADATDPSALAKAFDKADSAYVMIPPNSTSTDFLAYQSQVSDSIAQALHNSAVKNVVALSSVGADQPSGTGPIVGLHDFEQKLNQLDANVLHLRSGYFMENTLPQAAAIRMTGSALGPFHPDLRLPMIATCDIGLAAAEALLRLEFRGKQIQELHGQRDLDFTEAANIIGQAIGKPDLQYFQAPNDQVRDAMMHMEMSDNFAGLLLEMADSLNRGQIRTLEHRNAGNTTAMTYENFVSTFFVPAYQQQAAA